MSSTETGRATEATSSRTAKQNAICDQTRWLIKLLNYSLDNCLYLQQVSWLTTNQLTYSQVQYGLLSSGRRVMLGDLSPGPFYIRLILPEGLVRPSPTDWAVLGTGNGAASSKKDYSIWTELQKRIPTSSLHTSRFSLLSTSLCDSGS